MNKGNNERIDRLAGADAISATAIALGTELGVVVSKCIWDIGADFGHEYAHRLDLVTEKSTVRLYFSDLDLTMSGNHSRKERVCDRLRRAIAQLVAWKPSPTYSYR